MLDRWFEDLVDYLCVSVPVWLKTSVIRFSSTRLGWRLTLFVVTLMRRIGGIFENIRSEDEMDLFLNETSERMSAQFSRVSGAWRARFGLFITLDAFGEIVRFLSLLFFMLVSALGIAAKGGSEICFCAAFFGLEWLSASLFLGYLPVSKGIRQSYLFGYICKAAASACLLAAWFRTYASYGIASNIILQSAMLVLVFVHLALFLAAVAFNRRQQLVMRLLEGLLGIFPALAASAAIALLAAEIGISLTKGALAMSRAMGALVLFGAAQLEALARIGNVQFRAWRGVVLILHLLGYAMVLAVSWLA